jgi:hypothetical protein
MQYVRAIRTRQFSFSCLTDSRAPFRAMPNIRHYSLTTAHIALNSRAVCESGGASCLRDRNEAMFARHAHSSGARRRPRRPVAGGET